MVFNGVNTIYNIKLLNAKSIGAEYKLLPNTTLNEKFGIELKDNSQKLTKYPTINLLTIGVGAYDSKATQDTRINLIRSKHSPVDGALFQHVPFYLRPTKEIKSNPPSDNILLRKNVTIDGVDYLAGYGYEINDIKYREEILIYTSITKEYVNVKKLETTTTNILNPSPLKDTSISLSNKNTYITDFIKVHIYLTENELKEISNAMHILFGKNMPITELGVCNSIIKTKENNTRECYATQIAYFADSHIDIDDALNKKELEFFIDIGGMDILVS